MLLKHIFRIYEHVWFLLLNAIFEKLRFFKTQKKKTMFWCFLKYIYIYIYIYDAFFQSELDWSLWGSLSWTKTADGLNWRMPDRSGRGRIAAMLVYKLWMRHYHARRTRREKGRRGLCPWPLRCLSQTPSERKERMFRLLSIGVPFIDGLSMYL